MTSSFGTRPSLIASVNQNDSMAWKRLVDIYTPLMLSWCRQFGCDHHTSQDISQDAFLAAARSIHTHQPDGHSGSFRRWLWAITRNKLIDHRRRWPIQHSALGGSTAANNLSQLPETNRYDDLVEPDPSSPNMVLGVMQRAMAFVQVEFHESSWQAFWLTAVEGTSTEAVAEKLQMTPAAIRQARSRIMRRLRVELGDQFEI